MIAFQDSLREQDGNVAVEGRGVRQVGNEFAALVEDGLAHDVVHVRDGEFHLAVDVRLPGAAVFGIVLLAVLAQIVQDGTEENVVAELERRIGVRHQREVHFGVGSAGDLEGLGEIAEDGGCQDEMGLLFFRLDGIGSRSVGGGAGHRSVKIDRGEGKILSRRHISHLPLHAGGLGIGPDGCEKEP